MNFFGVNLGSHQGRDRAQAGLPAERASGLHAARLNAENEKGL